MPLLLIAAAASFACLNPTHHDGDAIRCAGAGKAMRLDSIDAPEMPGACRPGRDCTPGDPYAARDHLAALTAGRNVICEQRDTDHYGRRIVRCSADGVDLSCAMVADGYAVERYSPLNCGQQQSAQIAPQYNAPAEQYRAPPSPPPTPEAPPTRYYAPSNAEPASPSLIGLFGAALWLLAINIAAYAAFAIDKRRARTDPRNRIPEARLLLMAATGGSIGAIYAQQKLRHKTRKQPFATWLLAIAGIQIGAIIGLIYLNVF